MNPGDWFRAPDDLPTELLGTTSNLALAATHFANSIRAAQDGIFFLESPVLGQTRIY